MLVCTGFAAPSAAEPLGPYAFNRRDIGAQDVRIEILFCGVCYSDLHFARNEWRFTVYPCVPGHEIVGRVAEVGPEVTKYKIGDHVGVGCIVDSCRRCLACKEGFGAILRSRYDRHLWWHGGSPRRSDLWRLLGHDRGRSGLRAPDFGRHRLGVRRSLALRGNNPLLTAPSLGRGPRQEGRHCRSWRPRA
jgi:hypothetical protein